MINLLSTRQKQYLKIVNLTFQNAQKKTILCKNLGVTIPTIETIIDDFNDLFSPMKLKCIDSIVMLEIPEYLSYDYFIAKLLTISLEYQILESIFFNNTFNYDQLSQKLFVSRSTLIRTIKKINRVIHCYGFFIDTKPLQINGDERNIRCFIIAYFKAKYGLSNLPFQKTEIDAIKRFYIVGTKLVRLTPSIQGHNNFLLFCIVSLKREILGYSSKDGLCNIYYLIKILALFENMPFF
ncbi:hypothetical protein FG877_10655 [Enterococcus casseliflavus]|nr:hypothetical protein [Enterococcus casseliflavus]